MTTRRAVLTAALGGISAAVLGGCGSPDVQAAPHNAADVYFAQTMIGYHRQAVEIAELAATRAEDPRLTALAAEIEQTQSADIATMAGWLERWGEPVPSSDTAEPALPGLIDVEQMAALGTQTGQGFDAMFVPTLTLHHAAAIAAAEPHLTDGTFPPARSLAQRVIDTHTATISQLEDLYEHA